jgi:hypothetical protein
VPDLKPSILRVLERSGHRTLRVFVALPARLAYVPSMREMLTLFRPVGAQELARIAAAEFRASPPRRSSQPIFYRQHAHLLEQQIAAAGLVACMTTIAR